MVYTFSQPNRGVTSSSQSEGELKVSIWKLISAKTFFYSETSSLKISVMLGLYFQSIEGCNTFDVCIHSIVIQY